MSALGAERVVLVDNGVVPPPGDDPRVLHAPRLESSYFARNRGAEVGDSEWIVFLDDDAEPAADLLERYFIPPADEDTAVLAGEIRDEVPDDIESLSLAARFAALRAPMDQSNTLGHGKWAYAQTANVAVRRTAFEQMGGFEERVRSGGDADLCFRLRAAGWELESRNRALAAHHARTTLAALLRQRARHGAGAAWLEDRYPGFFPRRGWLGLTRWTAAMLGRAASRALRGDRAAAAALAIEPLSSWAFELGRLGSNRATVRRPA